MSESILTKPCSHCKHDLPATPECFSPDLRASMGLQSQCKPCKNRLRRQRTATNPALLEAGRKSAKQWRQNNLEKAKARARHYYLKNRPIRLEKRRQYAAQNRHTVRAQSLAWKKVNLDRCRIHEQRRRAQKLKATRNDLTHQQWMTIKAHYGSRCVYCGRKMQRLTMDHIIPLSKGGEHTFSNVVPACALCNSKKNAGPPLTPVQPLLVL